ncbi:Extended synaptotagmin-2 [Seminavis robusta]|uniref:Extended synaptotagmin-2 n=1 Tax=Seminavis robusta TaxID=568900 RepID=A0A9N8DTE7_9STRA|nr:Extended synaptotagmin-2 [Seminavis robusta]|eukprot:Sro275_g105710.1 Extended synaptotagmin-2 (765) ;mRNA; f:35012-37306
MTTSTSTSTSTTSSSSRSSFWIGCMTGSVATAVALWWWQRQQAPSSREDEDEESATHRLSQRSKSSALRNQNPHVLLQSTRSLDDGEDPIHVSSFLTDLLHEMWDYLNVAGAAVIRDSVEPYFQDLPGPFKTLRFTKMDLGHSPIRMDNLKVRKIQDGMIQIDLDIVWNGHCDLQLQAEQNSMIQLGVKELKLSGPFSLWLKPLTNQLPIISAIQYAFINPPIVELKFTGLASVAESPLLTAAVRDAIDSSLLCVVLPNRMMYKMQSNNNYLDTYQPPVGVARVTAVRGRGFVIEKKLLTTDDIPDVYLNITFGANLNATTTTGSVWRTQTIRDNLSPEWLESRDFLLHDHGQKLRFHAWDEDPGPLDADDDLGRGSALIQEILMCKQRRLEVELLHVKTQKRTDAFVTMQCDFIPWTTDLSSLNTTNTNGMADDHEIAGLLVVLVHRAFHIPIAKPEDAATFVKVSFGNQEFQTSVVLHSPGYTDALNPKYEAAFEIPITAGMPITGANAQVTFQLILHSNTVIGDTNHGTKKKNESSRTVAPPEQVLGSLTVHLDALRSAKDHTLTQTKPIGKGGASLEYRVSLSGVQRSVSKQQNGAKLQPGASVPRVLPSNSSLESSTTSGIMNGTSHDEEPSIGRLRLTVVKGRGFKISAELFNIDVPDAFCTIRFGSSKELWTTSVQRNNCNPVWNESKEYSLQSHSQVIALEVLDKNERSYDPDLHVGSAKTTVGNVLLAGGSVELELSSRQGRPTTVFITLGCELL